jgi:hypothetical protein
MFAPIFQYTSQDTTQILNMDTYNNGRVNTKEFPDADARFAMFDRIAVKNRATDYREPLNNNLEDTLLSTAFFSAGNIQILQNGLRAGVYRQSGNQISIPPQNIDQLKIIMKTMFSQYAEFSPAKSVAEQVAALNTHVLNYVIPYLYNEAIAYVKYCNDQSTLVMPLELPKQTDRDFKELEYKRFF